MSDLTNFGSLALGQPFELFFSTITDPVAGTAYTDLSTVNMLFTCKRRLSDADGSAIATVRDGDSGYNTSAGALTLRLITNAESEGLVAGAIYYFDGWLRDSNAIWRPFNFGTAASPSHIGYFTTTRAVSDAKS